MERVGVIPKMGYWRQGGDLHQNLKIFHFGFVFLSIKQVKQKHRAAWHDCLVPEQGSIGTVYQGKVDNR